MKEAKELSDDELRMQEYCKILASLKAQRQQARLTAISAGIGIENLNGVIAETAVYIEELERKGIKKVVVEEVPKNDKAGPQDPKIRT